jgi:hypothetical protein
LDVTSNEESHDSICPVVMSRWSGHVLVAQMKETRNACTVLVETSFGTCENNIKMYLQEICFCGYVSDEPVLGSCQVAGFDISGAEFYCFTTGVLFTSSYVLCLTHWPRDLRHEMSSPAQTLGSWVRIALEAWMSAFLLCLCCPVYTAGLAARLISPPRSPTNRS